VGVHAVVAVDAEDNIMKQHDNVLRFAAIVATLLLLVMAIEIGTMNTKLEELNNKLGSGDMVKEAGVKEPEQAVRDQPKPAGAVDMKPLVDDDDVKGDPDAPVTIVEWSDFECPFCARFYSQTLSQIDENYIKTGKVKLIFRDFPLNFHANAQKAAEAAECAGEQDKYWEMHDKLFEDGVKGGVDSYKEFAKGLGLDTTEFDSCLDSGEMADEVAKDMRDGSSNGIKGTPGFLINGKLVSGAQPYAVFKQAIDEALAQ